MFGFIHTPILKPFDQTQMENSAYNMTLMMVGCVGLLLMLSKQGSAEQHVVGGKQGWDESTDFDSWASGQTFKVGDTLVFKYSPMHSVAELGSESEYKKCDVGSATNSMSDGNSVVKLTKEGTRYFACGTAGHCDSGMKDRLLSCW
ncbi:unnamed protein product [Lactuca saligna]|uniref:Phytocyanin domain-containing protein n=1 Tax=Lactuca saligna TaxID=75948 RepID=A0AA35Z0G6_LACSI|nr:unnamed protein product [Lactuca saligna]